MLRELQALCRSHGLPAGGSNADLAARLAATLPSGRGGAEEKVVVAAKGVVGKGCLKRSGGGSSGGRGSGPAKKVTFVLEGEAGAEMVTVTEVRRRSRRLRR